MKRRVQKGINLTTIFTVFLVSLVAIFVTLEFVSNRINKQYISVQSSIDSYIICEKASQTIKDVANYLTDKAQLFIMNHEVKYVDEYIEEKFVTKRRESAVQDLLDMTSPTDITYRRIQIAMEQSESLSKMEMYAMALAYEAMGVKDLPIQFAGISVDRNSNLVADEKQKTAEQAIFGDGYSISKLRVNENCASTISDIENNIQRQLQDNSERLSNFLHIVNTIQLVLLVLTVVFFVLIAFLVLMPLRSFVSSIRSDGRLEVVGSREFRFLAETYNDVHEFDALTNILNRRAFEELCQRSEESKDVLALIFVDLDNFKGINDTLGHAKGDLVLKNVASNLKAVFRKKDHVFRIGGDEFAVICPGLTKENEDTVIEKINILNNYIAKIDMDYYVSVSAGMAFSTNGYSKTLYENADKALYKTKENGKRGISVWDQVL